MAVGTPEPPEVELPQATRLPSVFWATNAEEVEKTCVKRLPAGALALPPKLAFPHETTVPSFLRAVNAWGLETIVI